MHQKEKATKVSWSGLLVRIRVDGVAYAQRRHATLYSGPAQRRRRGWQLDDAPSQVPLWWKTTASPYENLCSEETPACPVLAHCVNSLRHSGRNSALLPPAYSSRRVEPMAAVSSNSRSHKAVPLAMLDNVPG